MIDEETGEEWHFEHLRSAEEAYESVCKEYKTLKKAVRDYLACQRTQRGVIPAYERLVTAVKG